jgi:hypothetical protein
MRIYIYLNDTEAAECSSGLCCERFVLGWPFMGCESGCFRQVGLLQAVSTVDGKVDWYRSSPAHENL